MNSTTNIIQLPLAFVRSGNVNLNYGQERIVGESGYGWSRTTSSSTDGRALWFNPTGVHPSGSHHRWGGFPFRCLYPGN